MLAFASAASAQPRQVDVSAGPGVKITDGSVLHPTLGVRGGYISNVFYEEEDQVGAGVLYVLAGLHLATLPPERLHPIDGEDSDMAHPKLQFRIGGQARYQEILSSSEAAKDQRALGAQADLELVAFPYGPFRIELEDHFVRYVRPRNFETTGSLHRDVNDLHAGFVIQPGGRMLQFGAFYENTIDVFESPRVEFANRIQHRVRARADWTFLPYTKAFLEGSLGFFDGLGDSQKVPSMPLRVQLGLLTAITPNFTVRARAGYAQGFYESGADYQAPIGGVELGWEYRPLGRIELGYQYDYRDSINANFYSEHQARLAFSQGVGRAVATLYGTGYLRTYQGIPAFFMPDGGATARTDVILETGAELAYHLRDWLVLSALYELSALKSDTTYNFMGEADDPRFLRHDATLGLEVRY